MKISFLTLLFSMLFLISCSKDDNVLNNETEIPAPDPVAPVIQQTFNGQILNSFSTMDIFKIIKKDDGFIFFTHELITEAPLNTGIRISKTDNQLNLIWTFLIDKSSETDVFAGVLELNNNEYIAILKKFSHTNSGLYNNEVYGIKFNESGNIIWEKNYSMNNVDANTHLDDVIKFTNNSNNLKIMFRSDSTYYSSDEDYYYREVKLNSDGDVLENKILNTTSTSHLQNIIYDNFENKYNIGGIHTIDFTIGNSNYTSFNALLTKYNTNNSLVFDKSFGLPRRDDIFHRILIDNNNKPILIGQIGVPGDQIIMSRWIAQFNELGNIVWEIKEPNTNPYSEYYGKDIIQDDDGNYLSLFEDHHYGYNLVTLIKSNNQGQILWKYNDGVAGNTDTFSPRKVMRIGNEYSIFGVNEHKLWLKKIQVN